MGDVVVYYAHKKSVGTVLKCDKNFTLETPEGTKYGFKGDGILTDLNRDQHIIPAEEMLDYVPVRLVKQSKSKQLSPFEEQHYKVLFGEVKLNQEEDQEYITRTKKLIENKPC